MTVDQTPENKNQSTNAPAHISQAHFDEWFIGSGVSEVIAWLYLESLDDTRVIVYRASQSTSAIGEVL